jgi:hypothetical protein
MPAERYLCKEACSNCGKPVYADEGYHGISKDHYSCHKDQLVKLDECIAKLEGVDSMLSDLGITDESAPKKRRKKKVREGEGRIAQKCLKMLTEAFERETEGKVVSANIWNQQGQYRGPHWDLAAFGVDFEFTLEGSDRNFTGSIASWLTMTAVSKLSEITLSASDMSYTYEI